jgi:glycosyltransferase involved in cell wall biosynthesis
MTGDHSCNPSLGVIIPAYNAGPFIAATVRSVLSQSVRPSEIIVVDDQSTDGTGTIAAGVHPSVKVLRQSNTGQGGARQRGLAASFARYLMFLDADDCLHPDALQKLVDALEEHPKAVLAYGNADLAYPHGYTGPRLTGDLEDGEGEPWDRLIHGNFIRTPGCVVMRRESLMDAGGWDPARAFQGNEDWDLWLRMAETGPFVHVDERLIDYRVHPEGYSKNLAKMYRSMLAVYAKHRQRYAVDAGRAPVIVACERQGRALAAAHLFDLSRQAFAKGDTRRSIKLLLASFRNSPDRTNWMHQLIATFKDWLRSSNAHLAPQPTIRE